MRFAATPRWPHATYAIGLALYLVLSTMWLAQPGPYYDEWIFVPVSLRTLGACDLEAAVTHHLRCLPLTQAPSYVGVVKAWAMAPVLGVFGVNAWSVRLPPILLGLATLVLLYRLLRSRLGETAGACVLLLLCMDAAMIWHTRLDWGPFAIANFCKVAAFASLLRWLDDGRTRSLAFVLAALCIGLLDKLNFLWVTTALGATALLLEPRTLWNRLRTAARAQWWLLAGAAALHLFALWALVIPALRTPVPGLPEALPLAQRATALWHLYDVTFGGSSVFDWIFTARRPDPHWPAYVQAALFALTPVAWWRLRHDVSPAARLFRWSTALLVTLLLCLLATTQVGGSHHAIVLWPWPVLQAAALFVTAWQRSAATMRRHGIAAVALLACIAFGITQAATHAAFARQLAAQGPYRPYFDPALAEIADFARTSGARTVASAHWGLHVALLSLAGSQVHRGYRDWWPILAEPPNQDAARTAYLRREFVAGGRLALVEWTAPELATATYANDYLAAWGACLREVRDFSSANGAALARVRLFDIGADGQCPPSTSCAIDCAKHVWSARGTSMDVASRQP